MVRGRLVALEGTLNFRDLGGYAAADGRTVRWGRLYRADALGALTAPDLEVLAALGIATVCDLRGVNEAAALPDVEIAGSEYVSLPMGEGDADHGGVIGRVVSGELAGITEADMAAIYASLLERFAPQLGRIVTLAAEPDRLPLACSTPRPARIGPAWPPWPCSAPWASATPTCWPTTS